MRDIHMNFDFSDDQRLLQGEVGRMLTDISTSAEVREVLEGRAPFSQKTWVGLAEMGAAGAAIPEAFGGSGLGRLELCLVAEEAGRTLVAAPLLSSIYLASETLLRAGSEQQKAAWLPRIASGKLIATAALGRSERVLKTDALTLTGGKLTGVVNAIPDGAVAGLIVVLVGDALVLADLNVAGVTRTVQPSLDPTRPLAQLRFENTSADVLVATDGAAIAEQVLQGAAVLLAFEQLGGANRALQMARDYALERRAFGRQIGGFQAIKHKLADIYVANELARVHAYYGAWALSTNAPELPRAAAAARVAATRAYDLAAEEGLETHGGIGFTWEMDCHLHLRRARWLGQIIGSQQLWNKRLADAVIAISDVKTTVDADAA